MVEAFLVSRTVSTSTATAAFAQYERAKAQSNYNHTKTTGSDKRITYLQESATNRITIDDEFDIETVKRMLQFMYEEEYNSETQPTRKRTYEAVTDPNIDDASDGQEASLEVDSTETWLLHVRVNAIADYYDIHELREASADELLVLSLSRGGWSADGFV
jgi:hypothetical protein